MGETPGWGDQGQGSPAPRAGGEAAWLAGPWPLQGLEAAALMAVS